MRGEVKGGKYSKAGRSERENIKRSEGGRKEVKRGIQKFRRVYVD